MDLPRGWSWEKDLVKLVYLEGDPSNPQKEEGDMRQGREDSQWTEHPSSSFCCGQLNPNLLRNSGRCWVFLSYPNWEVRVLEYVFTNSHPLLVEVCSWHFQPMPQRNAWGRRLLMLQLKLSICTGMTERMWTGYQQCSPKFINISWMNKCRALWVPKHVGFKSFKTKCRSFHSTASTFIVYFWKS